MSITHNAKPSANPFQSPESDIDPEIVLADDEQMRVDGDYLIVRSGAVLPSFCVLSDVPIASDSVQQKTLRSFEPNYALFLICPPALFVFYVTDQVTCLLTYGISPKSTQQLRIKRLCLFVFVLMGIALIPAALRSDFGEYLIFIIPILWVTTLHLFLGFAPLQIHKTKNNQYWISGCSRSFLARIRLISDPESEA